MMINILDHLSGSKAILQTNHMAAEAYFRAIRRLLYWRCRLGPIVEAERPHQLDRPLVISLTSHPPRFKTLPLTLKCLLSQSVKPNTVVLWIAHNDRSYLTQDILQLQERGLTIRYCEDLRSYNKIIPTLDAYPNSYIVTADDDIHYHRGWLESLISTDLDRMQVIALRAYRIRLGEDNFPLRYLDWEFPVRSDVADPLLFAAGVGGVLYPPGTFSHEVFNAESFMRLCPRADDVWLYWMARLNGKTVRQVGRNNRLHWWPGSQTVSLWSGNQLADDGNDAQIANLIKKYGFPDPI